MVGASSQALMRELGPPPPPDQHHPIALQHTCSPRPLSNLRTATFSPAPGSSAQHTVLPGPRQGQSLAPHAADPPPAGLCPALLRSQHPLPSPPAQAAFTCQWPVALVLGQLGAAPGVLRPPAGDLGPGLDEQPLRDIHDPVRRDEQREEDCQLDGDAQHPHVQLVPGGRKGERERLWAVGMRRVQAEGRALIRPAGRCSA